MSAVRLDHVKYLKEIDGCSTAEAIEALQVCNGDCLTAEGWLRYKNSKPLPHEGEVSLPEWRMLKAQEYKQRHVAPTKPCMVCDGSGWLDMCECEICEGRGVLKA